MNFKLWMENMFKHPSNVPVDFAMSVYRILHNQATYQDWENLDAHETRNNPVIDWIAQILDANSVKNPQEEIKWFKQELSKGRN